MKKWIIPVMAFSVLVAVAPAMASDQAESFGVLNNITLHENAPLSQMSDDELAAVEGQGGPVQICAGCVNIAVVNQKNIAIQKANSSGAFSNTTQSIYQSNYANVSQNINTVR